MGSGFRPENYPLAPSGPLYPDRYAWWSAFWGNYIFNFKKPEWLSCLDEKLAEGSVIRDSHGRPMFAIGIPAAGLIRITQQGSAAISMDAAIQRAVNHVGKNAIMETTGNGMNFQFRSATINALGQVETRIGRFDINPASPHVQRYGPHLNLETQINGRPTGFDPHTPIKPSTIRSGDIP